MRQFLNKKVFLKIQTSNDKTLFFTATITEVTDTHIFFIDKYGLLNSYLITDIIEAKQVEA